MIAAGARQMGEREDSPRVAGDALRHARGDLLGLRKVPCLDRPLNTRKLGWKRVSILHAPRGIDRARKISRPVEQL